ncbi:MAG TPA: hypothetical protein PKO33_04985 [Pyrinomonadaceae bacterium]|nr:hypothetical protein [Pyrinomonadaceae bacterium]
MKSIIRNILAFIAGLIALVVVKMIVTKIGNLVIPPPAGIDLSTVEGWNAAMPLFEVKHWVTPFLEHSIGSFFGGSVVALLAATQKTTLAIAIGVLHLLGGIIAAALLPVPVWFSALDLIVAYVPMALLGGMIGARK